MSDPVRITRLIKQYSQFIAFPIKVRQAAGWTARGCTARSWWDWGGTALRSGALIAFCGMHAVRIVHPCTLTHAPDVLPVSNCLLWLAKGTSPRKPRYRTAMCACCITMLLLLCPPKPQVYSPKKEPKKVVDEEATKRKQEAADKKAKEANEEPKPVGAARTPMERERAAAGGRQGCVAGVGMRGYQRVSQAVEREAARGTGGRCGPGKVELGDVVLGRGGGQ